MSTVDRLFGYEHAFDHPVTVAAVVAAAALGAGTGIAIKLLWRSGRISDETYDDLYPRWRSSVWIGVLILVPILLGAAWTMAAVALLSLACFSEFARTTGLFREKAVSAVVVLGIALLTFAAVDHFERLHFALGPLTVALIAAITIPSDRPKGYLQRVALGAFGFLMFGFSLGYLGNIANVGDLGNGADYRPVLVMIFLGVALNDVFASCLGRLLGGPKLLPNTSRGKTLFGTLGAMLLTAPLVAVVAHFVFHGTPADNLSVLLSLGILISGLGHLGNLVLSCVKRDVGVEDVGATISGHGGLLDRFGSLILVPPAVYHYLSWHLGPLAGNQAARIITGGG